MAPGFIKTPRGRLLNSDFFRTKKGIGGKEKILMHDKTHTIVKKPLAIRRAVTNTKARAILKAKGFDSLSKEAEKLFAPLRAKAKRSNYTVQTEYQDIGEKKK